MKKEIIKKFNKNKYLIIFLLLLCLIVFGIFGREYLIQRSIDRCYSEAKQRYDNALKNVPTIKDCPERNTKTNEYSWTSVICDEVEDVDTKLKLKEQLGEDEARCLRRYR